MLIGITVKILLPNLSPFIDDEAEGCVPEYAETIKRLQAAAKSQVLPMPLEKLDLNVPQVLLVEGIVDMTEANKAAERNQKLMMLEKQYHDELNMELGGTTFSSLPIVNPTAFHRSVKNGKRIRLKLLHERKKNAEARKKLYLFCPIYRLLVAP